MKECVTERKQQREAEDAQLMQTFNSASRTGKRDGESEVAGGCQVCCSVWDSASKAITSAENLL